MIIEDGTGNGYKTLVNERKQLYVRAVSETVIEHAVELGQAYNINTGNITLTGTVDVPVLYFKNRDSSFGGQDYELNSIAVGFGTGSLINPTQITIVRDPSAGTIITNATNVDIIQNRNLGSSKEAAVDAYKGALGDTMTGGSNIAHFYQTSNGRLYASVNFSIPKGSTIGIKINPNLASGEMLCYVALIGHFRDPQR